MDRLLGWGRKWWPGLIPLAILWLVAIWTTTAPLEKDIGARATAAVKDSVLDKAEIDVSGRDVRFSADAFSEEGRRNAAADVEAVAGIRRVHDETRLVPEAKPFVWSVERDVVRMTLGGSAPLPAIKARLIEAARAAAGGGSVDDRMKLSRGAPPRFDTVALLLIDQVGKLKDGKVTLTDTSINLSGMARDIGNREAIAGALKNLPEGYSVAENTIKAPPYVFEVNKDPIANTLVLAGYVPDNSTHAAIFAAAGRKFFSEKIIDNLKASAGAPAGFAAAAAVALSGLSRVSSGWLLLSDKTIKLSGDALYAVAADQIKSSFATEIPQGWTATAEISVKPVSSPVDPTVCQQLFSEILAKATIRFESGRATIDPDSQGLLDRLIEAALRCPTANIEVAGHTDSDGDPAANQALSAKRAQSVADYLIQAGLPADRLKALGYGSNQPLASNDTDEGKAKNRRIELLVR